MAYLKNSLIIGDIRTMEEKMKGKIFAMEVWQKDYSMEKLGEKNESCNEIETEVSSWKKN